MAGVPLWLDQNVHTGCWVQGCRQVQLEGSELKLILPQIIKYIIMLHLHSTRVIQPCVSPTLEVRNQTSGRQSHIQMPAAKQQNQHSHLSNLKAHTPLLPHANLLHRFPSGEDNSCVSTNREETASFLKLQMLLGGRSSESKGFCHAFSCLSILGCMGFRFPVSTADFTILRRTVLPVFSDWHASILNAHMHFLKSNYLTLEL